MSDTMNESPAAPKGTAGKIAHLRELGERASTPTAEAVAKQHGRGRLTARERIARLLDKDSFVELDRFVRHRCTEMGAQDKRPHGDSVVTGYGTIDGRQVYVYAQDATRFGGSVGEVSGEKVVKVLELAQDTGCPVIGINDGGGARVQEGVVSLAAYADMARANILLSGVVPHISLIMGSCAGGAVYAPALTDFIVMVEETSQMFVTGVEIIKEATGEDISREELGGARIQNERTGNAHYLAADEDDALAYTRHLLSYLPQNNVDDGPEYLSEASSELTDRDSGIDALVPDSATAVFDMRGVITCVLDDGDFLEVHELFARNIIVGFGRIEGRSVGVVANQSTWLAGALDIDACEKAARFIRFCDAFNIPLVTLVDVPGFLPGTEQEWNGLIRRAGKLGFAYVEATVPKVTVAVRKAYGGGYAAMGSKHLATDAYFAWPTAQIAVIGAQSAVDLLFSSQLAEAEDPDAVRQDLIQQYEETIANPWTGADRGWIDDVIAPADTRLALSRALRALRTKRRTLPPKKHNTMPF